MKSHYQVSRTRIDDRTISHDAIDLRRPPEITTGVLSVVIPYTTPGLTRAAMWHAGACSDLDVQVALIDVQIVPFPCLWISLRSAMNTPDADYTNCSMKVAFQAGPPYCTREIGWKVFAGCSRQTRSSL
jgi:hypothetical protein